MARKSSSGEDSEWHIVAIRMNINGSGDLQMALKSLDDAQVSNLVPFTMTPTAGRIVAPTRLANFQSQRASLFCETTEIDETFRINKIIIFAKPVAVEYPG